MIEDWIEQHIDSTIKHTNNPYEIHICCPVCGDTRYRMYINLKSGMLYCHNCQFKGSFANLIQYVTGSTWDKAMTIFKDLGGDLPTPSNIEKSISDQLITKLYNQTPVKRSVPLPTSYQYLDGSTNLVAERARRYLFKRGITEKQIVKHKIGFCTIGEYAGRIIIPIMKGDTLKFWVARSVNPENKLKEKSPSNREYQYSKSEVIFNLDNAVKKYNSIVISEGIFDALSWGDIGVSLLGKVLYPVQLELLLEYKDEITQGVYIALDADARDSATKIAEQLSPFFDIKIINIPDEFDDPNKYLLTHSRKDMWRLIENAHDYSEFSIVERKLQVFR